MKTKPTIREPKGFVIVVVLCMVILLSVLLLGFNHKSRANLRTADDLRKSHQALNCAKAGLNIAIAALAGDEDIYENKALHNMLSGKSTLTVAGGDCSITLTEESGKLNVNYLANRTGRLDRTRAEQVLRLIDLLNRNRIDQPHIGYGLVPAIIDWIDADDLVTSLNFIKRESLGAESDYYSELKSPYNCKDAPLDSPEELLLIKGVTPQTFNRMRDYLTVYGDGDVNINSAPKLVIETLTQEMDSALAQMIVARREFKPFESVIELRNVPGMTDEVYYAVNKKITVAPTDRHYQVVSRGNVDDSSNVITAILAKNTKSKKVEVVLYRELEDPGV